MDFELTAEQQDLQERAPAAGAEFREAARGWDETDEAPYREVFDRMGELGFYAISMPKEHGGQGKTAFEYFLATSAIFRASQSWLVCEPLFCTSGPGPSMLLLGDDEVQRNYLPEIVAGGRGCNIALTEPGHGSALTHLETAARLEGDELHRQRRQELRHRRPGQRPARGLRPLRRRPGREGHRRAAGGGLLRGRYAQSAGRDSSATAESPTATCGCRTPGSRRRT